MKSLSPTTALSLWLLAIALCGIYVLLRINSGYAFESNILALIPHEGREQWQPKLGDDSSLQRGFIILVSQPNAERGLEIASELMENLAQRPGIKMTNTGNFPAALGAEMKPYRHQLLSPYWRRQLKDKDAVALAKELYESLYSPMRALRLYDFADDPFNLGGSWLAGLLPDTARITPGAIPSVNADGVIWYLLRGTLGSSSFNPAAQEDIAAALSTINRDDGTQVLTSGLVFHAAEATRITRTEIATIGTGSLMGIVLLVTFALRSTSAMLAMGLTILTSTLMAVTVTLMLFDSVHLITVVFGSTLLGLAVGYSFHFIVKYRRTGDAMATWLLLRKGLLFSLAASCLAYLVQLVSPFPGLRQFAIFVPAGLIGAFCSVWVLAYCYQERPEKRINRVPRLYNRWIEPLYLRLGNLPRFLPLALLALTAGFTHYLQEKGFNDDIHLLNTSSPQLLDAELRVRELLGGIEPQRYWVVEGRNAQQVLERSEATLAILAAANGGQSVAMSASQLVPSLKQQREDFALVVEKLYGPGGAIEKFCAMVGSDCVPWSELPGKFSAGLTPAAISTNISSNFPALMLSDERHGILLPYRHTPFSGNSLEALGQLDYVQYVDRVERISSILAGFREEVVDLFALFLLILTIGSFVAYRTRGLLLSICIVFSLTAALASSAQAGITLFHVLALLLVLGFSVDTAIFYLELGFTAETWLASSLSTCTELLAFGLLAFSRIPLLHYFGCVVFTGLMCSWLLTPAFYLLATRLVPRQFIGSINDRKH